MDTKLKYREIIKRILTLQAEYRASIPDNYDSQVVFDDINRRYLVLDIGWSENKYLQPLDLSVEIKNFSPQLRSLDLSME